MIVVNSQVYRGFLLVEDEAGQISAYRSMDYWNQGIRTFIAYDIPTMELAIDEADDTGEVGEDERITQLGTRAVPARYTDKIMGRVRMHIGLEEGDNSRDYEINQMSGKTVLTHVLEWEGIIGYEHRIVDWVEEIFSVILT